MITRSRRRVFALLACITLALLGIVVVVQAQASPVTAAWQRARAAGAYHFGSDVVQVTTPSATITNAGRKSREDRLRLEGETDLRARSMELRLWTGAGSVQLPASAAAVRVRDDKTLIRQGDGAWKPAADMTGALAPRGDWMAYLAAVRDVEAHQPEQHAGIAFTRYTFGLDGPTFAGFMRDQLAETMRRQGALQPGASVELPQYYAQMRGEGELWVGRNGLPLRQVLHLRFPEHGDEAVAADITVDFWGFAPLPARSLLVVRLMGALSDLRANPMPLASLVLWLTIALLVVRARHTRLLQRALPLVVILALLVGPLLDSARASAFLDAQAAQAAKQDEESDMQRTLRSFHEAAQDSGTENTETGPAAPAVAGAQPVAVASTRAASGATSPSPAATQPAALLLDTDLDGLPDVAEQEVGTDPTIADTDGDTISDALEVRGFGYAGRQWYGDPLEVDSNRDGLLDGQEWLLDADHNGLPDDSDNDGVPDPFDDDNDGDGVLDRKDISPNQHAGAGSATTVFSDTNPLALTLAGVEPGKLTYVDFQLRPRDPDHLWFAQHVLDWPEDRQAQVQDGDGGTWADVARAQGRTPEGGEENGDLKLVPMLEIRIPASPPPTRLDNLPSAAELEGYNIAVNELTADGSEQVVYVPLAVVADEDSGQRVAFSGRMVYRPGAVWGPAHQARLVWAVQALVDECKQETDGQCSEYAHINTPQVIHTYYDAWTLTGFAVRENHRADLAVIYEDPAVDPDINDDQALWLLAHGLDNAFLSARDQDGDNRRDLTLAEIARRFDHPTNNGVSEEQRWAIPNILRVEQHAYEHPDTAVATTTMTDSRRILDGSFGPRWSQTNQIRPTLMYAREEQFRATGLDPVARDDGYVTLNGNSLAVNLQPAGKPRALMTTSAGLKWTTYCAEPGVGGTPSWSSCELEDAWDEIERRYAAVAAQPGDTPAMVNGRVVVSQLYYLALAQGINSVVEQNLRIVPPTFTPKPDSEIVGIVRAVVGAGRSLVPTLADFVVLARVIDKVSVLSFFGTMLKGTRGTLVSTMQALKAAALKVKVGISLVIAAIFLVVAALVTAAAVLLPQVAATQGSGPIITGFKHGLVIVLALVFSVIVPLVAAVQWINVVRAAGASLGTAVRVVFSANTAAVGTSAAYGAIGAVIGIAITWGFFIYAMVSNKVGAFTPEFNRAFAEALATTIYLIVLAVLSATVIGFIIVGIVGFIDAILTAVCELGVEDLRKVPGLGGACFTLGTSAIKVIAKVLYSFDLMIDAERRDLVTVGTPDIVPVNPNLGMSAGNPLLVTLPITTTIMHKDPAPENWLHILPYLPLFNEENLRSTTIRYNLEQSEQQVFIPSLPGSMASEWQQVRPDHTFLGKGMLRSEAHTRESQPIIPTAGLNQNPKLVLNMGHALPAYECWAIPNIFFPFIPPYLPVCYTRLVEGDSHTPIDAIRLDIMPATLDAFMAQAPKTGGGLALAWDGAFTALADGDNDGLRGEHAGGLDPNDASPDGDGDGLTDLFELKRREAGVNVSPVLFDTDGDGLTDAQEAQLGTHPVQPDSDNDGLSDGEEVYHQVYELAGGRLRPTNRWEGGWTITVDGDVPFPLLVSSDPLAADGDGDGVSDEAERDLAGQRDRAGRPYHPRIKNANPLVVSVDVDDLDRIVRPGDTVAYTTTVGSSGQPFGTTLLDVAAPAVLGGEQPPRVVDLTRAQTATLASSLSIAPSAATGAAVVTSTVRGRLPNQAGPRLSWNTTLETPLTGLPRLPWMLDLAPDRSDRQDSMLLAGLVSDTGQNRARGDIRAVSLPGGTARGLDNDTFLNGPAAPDTSFLRMAQAPRISCNATGVCMTVWDHFDNCNTFTIHSIFVAAAAADVGNGIEPLIRFDPLMPGRSMENLWFSAQNGGNDMPAGQARGPNAFGFPLRRTFCGPGRISVVEVDGNGTPSELQPVGTFDLIPDVFMDQTVTFSGSGHTIRLRISTENRHQYDVVGSVTVPGLQVRRSQFRLATPTDFTTRDLRPVVATDGNNFMVAWERLFAQVSSPGRFTITTRIVSRIFDANGNPLTSELEVDEVPTVFNNLPGPIVIRSYGSLEIVAMRDRYRIARKLIHMSQITTRDYGLDGKLIPGSSVAEALDAATGDFGEPRMAYHPLADRVMMVYRSSTGSVLARIARPDTAKRMIVVFSTSGEQPRVVYQPLARAWLVGWSNTTTPTRFDYQLRNADGVAMAEGGGAQSLTWQRPLAPTGANGTALTCPAFTSQPVLDLRWEELPGATVFSDGSGRGRDGTCPSGNCPQSGFPGAPNALQSDLAARFDGVDDVVSAPIGDLRGEDFTVSFWLRTTQVAGGANEWTDGIRLVDGLSGTDVAWGVRLGAGRILFGTSGPIATVRGPNVADDRWHFIVATRERPTGRLQLFVDGVNAGAILGTTNRPVISSVTIGGAGAGGAFRGLLDHTSISPSAFGQDAITAVFNREQQATCAVAAPGANLLAGIPWARLRLQERDLRGGFVTESASLGLRVDADAPTSRVTTFDDGIAVRGEPGGTQTVIVGGTASDPTSNVTQVEVSVNGEPFQPASGGASWTFPLELGEGVYTIRTRATDAAGNVETPGPLHTLIVDATPPQVELASIRQPVLPRRLATGQWVIALSGSIADPAIGQQPGSGVGPGAVDVLLAADDADGSGAARGAGFQRATLTGDGWRLLYRFPDDVIDPTGSYTLTLRAADNAGNRSGDAANQSVLHVDASGPVATLDIASATRPVITHTLTLSGSVTDTNTLPGTPGTAGVARLDLDLAPIDQVVAQDAAVVELPLDEARGAVYYADSTAAQHDAHCVTTTCPVAGEPGRFDGALRFDGQALAQIEAGADLDFDADTSWTLQAWVKTASGGATILAKRGTGERFWTLGLDENGVAAFTLGLGLVRGGPDLRDDRWHHLVGVVDQQAGQTRLYVDGEQRASAASAGDTTNQAPIDLGGWSGATDGRYQGALDHVVLFRTALIADEVQALFHAVTTTRVAATLAQSGPGVSHTTWQAQIPAGLEGQFQIDLHAVDTLGLHRRSPNAWRGIIDTQAPRLVFTARASDAEFVDPTQQTPRFEVTFQCAAEDRHLDERSFSCSGAPHPPQRDFDDQPALDGLFPDLALLNRLSMSYTIWEPSRQPDREARACDTLGNCSVVHTGPSGLVGGIAALSLAPQATGLPHAVVVSPTNGTVVAAGDTLNVVIVAQADQLLRRVTISLDGTAAQTITLTRDEAITSTRRLVTIPAPGEGSHTLVAQALDDAGNLQTTLVPVVFAVDRAAPSVAIATQVLDLDDTFAPGSDIMRFSGTATDTVGLAAVQVRIGSGAYANALVEGGAWRMAMPVGDDPEGTTLVVTARATDLAGRVAEVRRNIPVRIPTDEPPQASITSGPPQITNSTAATFAFEGTAGDNAVQSFACWIDQPGDFHLCTSPISFTDLADGVHMVGVRAEDTQGNLGRQVASYTWIVDTTEPDTSITTGPAAFSNIAGATFVFTGADALTDIVGYECRLDGGAYQACVPGQNWTGLAEGAHLLEVRAFDEAGNPDQSPATYRWTVDSRAPETTIRSRPPEVSTSTTAEIDFDGTDEGASGVASWECQLDGGGWLPCTSPQRLTNLRAGVHTFQVRTRDQAGNDDPTPATVTWTVNLASRLFLPLIAQMRTGQVDPAGNGR